MEINLIYEGNNNKFQLSKDVTISFIKELGVKTFNIKTGTICLLYGNENLNKYGDNTKMDKIISNFEKTINIYIQLEGYSSKETSSTNDANKKRNDFFVDLLKNKFDNFQNKYYMIFDCISKFQKQLIKKATILIEKIEEFKSKMLIIDNYLNDFYQFEKYTNLVNFFEVNKMKNNYDENDMMTIKKDLDFSINQVPFIKSRYEFETNILEYFKKRIGKLNKIGKFIQNIEENRNNYNEIIINLDEIYSILIYSNNKKSMHNKKIELNKINSMLFNRNNNENKINLKYNNNNFPRIDTKTEESILENNLNKTNYNKPLSYKKEINNTEKAITQIYKKDEKLSLNDKGINIKKIHMKNNSFNKEKVYPKILNTESNINKYIKYARNFSDKQHEKWKSNYLLSDGNISSDLNKKYIKTPIEIPRIKQFFKPKERLTWRKDNKINDNQKNIHKFYKNENSTSSAFEKVFLDINKKDKMNFKSNIRDYNNKDIENNIIKNSNENIDELLEELVSDFKQNENEKKENSFHISNKNNKISDIKDITFSNLNHKEYKSEEHISFNTNNKKDEKKININHNNILNKYKYNNCIDYISENNNNYENTIPNEKKNKITKKNEMKFLNMDEQNDEKSKLNLKNNQIEINKNENNILKLKSKNEKKSSNINIQTIHSDINKKENVLSKNNLNENKENNKTKNENHKKNNSQSIKNSLNRKINNETDKTENNDKNNNNNESIKKERQESKKQNKNPQKKESIIYQNNMQKSKNNIHKKKKESNENSIHIPRRNISSLTGIVLFRKNSNQSLTQKESSLDDSIDKNYSYDLIEEKLKGNYSYSKKNFSKKENDSINLLAKTLSPRKTSLVKQLNKRLIELRHSFLYAQFTSDGKKKRKKKLVNKFDFII